MLPLKEKMNDYLPKIPVRDESNHTPIVSAQEKEYGKLGASFTGIFFISVILFLVFGSGGTFGSLRPVQSFAAQFMGVFLVVFALIKLVNLKNFVHGFRTYDLVAKKSMAYAKSYPFIQLTLGVLMFIVPTFAGTYLLVAGIAGLGIVSVIAVSVTSKQKIQRTCLSNVIKMPLATVSGVENSFILVISLLMFFAMIG